MKKGMIYGMFSATPGLTGKLVTLIEKNPYEEKETYKGKTMEKRKRFDE
jgi:hypothetical protein